MERSKILEKSIALIGPKQVGKSFFAENLIEDKNTPDFVLSSDLLTNLIIYDLSGHWHSVVEGSELAEIGKLYKSIFNFRELSPLVESLAKCQQSKNLTPKAKKVAMSYWKARLLEEATEALNRPYILDAGADIGAVIELSNDEELMVSQAFYMPFDFIEKRMASFLKDFGQRIYLKPEDNYKNLQGRAQDAENAIYLESGKSYKPFATITVNCEDIYRTEKPKEVAVKSVIANISASLSQGGMGE